MQKSRKVHPFEKRLRLLEETLEHKMDKTDGEDLEERVSDLESEYEELESKLEDVEFNLEELEDLEAECHANILKCFDYAIARLQQRGFVTVGHA